MLRGFFVRRSVTPVLVWRARLATTAYSSDSLAVALRQGYPVISIPLPSKREPCDFTLRPYIHNVEDFLKFIIAEDGGIENLAVYSTTGNRVAKSTGLDVLLQSDFDLKINELKYRVQVPQEARFNPEGERSVGDVRNMVHKLYCSLNVDRHQLTKEVDLRGQLEQLKGDLAPLQDQKTSLEKKSMSHSNVWMWGGMAFMSLQLGFLARLTWWEYSWDIMEPVTYFVTYATSMIAFSYYIITRSEFLYPAAEGRVHLNHFHKAAKKSNFDIDRYNHLKDAIASVEDQLERLKDPLQLNLPTPPPKATSTDHP